MKRKEELLLVGLALVSAAAGVVYLSKNKASASTANTTGPFNYATGYDPTGGISIPNIGGSQALGGVVSGRSIGNSNIGDTPIGIDPLTGGVINTITHQSVDPSSWQGTTNSSGSLTYLNGILAGEGSSIGALQGVTY